MTTEYAKQKKPYPDETHAALVDRCLESYKADARRKARNRIIGYTALWLAAFGVSYVLWLLALEAIK